MKIEQLVKMEVTVILIVIGGVLFFTGRVIVGSSVTGMATYGAEVYGKVEAGMGFDEIREIFGEPDEVERMEERGIVVEYWHYIGRDYTLRIGFIDGKVDSKVVTR